MNDEIGFINGQPTSAGQLVLMGAILRQWYRSDARAEALTRARRACVGRENLRYPLYQCARCKGCFRNIDVGVSHVDATASTIDINNCASVLSDTFCPADRLAVLCKASCYRVTQRET